MRRPPENFISCNGVAKDRVHQNTAAVGGEKNQHLALDLAHFDHIFPTQPSPALSEQRKHAILVQHSVVAHVNVVAVLHRRRGDGTEEENNEAGEVEEFVRFWSSVPGVDQVRVKEDETNLLQAEAGHSAQNWNHPCHYLWRGPMYVKHNGDVYPCCQSYMLDGSPVGNVARETLPQIWNSGLMTRMRELHVTGRAGEIDICARCCIAIPHPVLVAGSLLLHGKTAKWSVQSR